MRTKILLGLALAFGFLVPVVADDAANVEPGKQVLKQATLNAAVGNPRQAADAVDPEKTATVDYWFFFPSDESAKT
ncbi:MAG: hypothetical protein IKX88_13705, partial [Thermoguttaceae bacterium]|nr:hypothetical protein [Thermoguttaceae bacterium]